jgi:tetratricopeptide (TPR) repeat protein
LNDLFAVQSELALRIAGALQAKLSPAEKAAIETLPTRDAEAYDLFLRAKEAIYSRGTRGDSAEDIGRAVDLLNKAISRDGSFALAYTFLAELDLMEFRRAQRPEQLERARICLEKSLNLSPDLGEARMVRGIYFYYGTGELERARAEFQIARSVLPNNAECLNWSGLLERRLGHWKEALVYQMKAADLDPRDGGIQADLLGTHYALRHWSEAERTIERAIIVSPQQTNYFRMKKVDVAFMKGDLSAARAGLQFLPPDFEFNGFVAYLWVKLALYERDFDRANQLLAEAQKKLGAKAEWWIARDKAFLARAEGDPIKAQAAWEHAYRLWEEDLRRNPHDAIALSLVAIGDAALGRQEEAIDRIERAVQERPLGRDTMDGPQLAGYRALIYSWCGKQASALEQLAALAKVPAGPDPGELKFHPRWDALRGDPRFAQILAEKDQPLKIE